MDKALTTVKKGMTVEEDVQRMKDEVLFLRLEKVVLVEGISDKPFWTFALNTVMEEKYEIFPYVNHPTFDTSSKTALLKYYARFASSDVIICIDSDYDYLLETPVLHNKYIFQTYTYSFENYHCYAPSLKKVVEKASNTEGVAFEFEGFMTKYSKIVYPYLIQSLWEAKNKPQNVIQIEQDLGKKIVLKEHWKNKTADDILSDLAKELSKIKLSDITDEFIEQLNRLGLTEDNAYLFIRGKNIFNGVVLVLINNLQEVIKNDTVKAFSTIEEVKLKNQVRKTYLDGLRNSKSCLTENFDFTDCFLFKKLELDIKSTFN